MLIIGVTPDMPRPLKRRRCQGYEGERIFKPARTPMQALEVVRLRLSELEAMRLCDVEGLDQQAAGASMGVSRGTIQRLLGRGREKVVRAILRSQALIIEERGHHEDVHPDPA